MKNKISTSVEVHAKAYFLEEQSIPEENHYVYAYKIRIKNLSNQKVQLISRHWIICDSNGEINEVHGEGVVGEQPFISPGEEFKYTSGSHLKTELGTMHGNYQMITEQGETLEVKIPCFTLSIPGVLN